MSGIIVGGTILNSKLLEVKLAKAFEMWAQFDANDYFRSQFIEDKWSYPGETERKSGEVARDPRNIFDLGDLYRSGRDSFKITQGSMDVTASWDWDAKNSSGRGYAWYVHEGLSTNLAPRQWTDIFQQQDLFSQSSVSKELRSRIRAALNK
jgi:hypothetical protein